MAKRKKETIQISTKRCLHCGMELKYKNFYQLHNSSNIYSGNDNYIPICKECLKIPFEQYRIQYMNQCSVLGTKPEALKEYEIEKLAVRRFINECTTDFILKIGTKTLIKRKVFGKFLERTDAI